jgi:hypothetical protein
LQQQRFRLEDDPDALECCHPHRASLICAKAAVHLNITLALLWSD